MLNIDVEEWEKVLDGAVENGVLKAVEEKACSTDMKGVLEIMAVPRDGEATHGGTRVKV